MISHSYRMTWIPLVSRLSGSSRLRFAKGRPFATLYNTIQTLSCVSIRLDFPAQRTAGGDIGATAPMPQAAWPMWVTIPNAHDSLPDQPRPLDRRLILRGPRSLASPRRKERGGIFAQADSRGVPQIVPAEADVGEAPIVERGQHGEVAARLGDARRPEAGVDEVRQSMVRQRRSPLADIVPRAPSPNQKQSDTLRPNCTATLPGQADDFHGRAI